MPQNPIPDQFTELGFIVNPSATPLLFAQPSAAAITLAINLMYLQSGFEIAQFSRLRVVKKNDVTALAAGNVLLREKNNAFINLPDGYYYWMTAPITGTTMEEGRKFPATSFYMQSLAGAFVGITAVPAPPIYAPAQVLLAIPSGSAAPVHGVNSTYSGVASTGGQASGLGYLWAAVSGSVPTFGSAQAAVTTINFATAGAFVISLSVNDPMRRGQVSTVTLSGTAS